MFHVEIRQFPGHERRFNLSADDLERLVLDRWRRGQAVVLEERRYTPGRARLRVLEGPRLEPGEIGLGRGWQNAERAGREVTEELLRRGPEQVGSLDAFRAAMLEACRSEPLALGTVVSLARQAPGARASACLALAEQAVWELLHQGRLELLEPADARAGERAERVPRERWEQVLLAWESWSGPLGEQPGVLAAAGEGAS